MSRQHDRKGSSAIRAVSLLIVVTFVVFFLAFVGTARPPAQAQSAGQAAQQTAQPTVIGARCQRCHKEDVQSFALDAHGKSGKFLKDSRVTTCESCHGDSEKHIQTKEAKDTINPAKLPAAQANESCLQCHARDRTHSNWRGGKHDRNDMSCMSCHSSHHAKEPTMELIAPTVEDTCLRCHTGIRKAIYQRSTHLFRTEHRTMKVTCTSCHDAHGGEGRKMLQARTVNDACYQCHADKRGPFLWEHAPVQQNCLTCHSPHGANNVSLLTTRSHQLCQQCHVNLLPRHSTVAGFDVFTFNRGCVNCHSQIHGSNHPAGRTFTR